MINLVLFLLFIAHLSNGGLVGKVFQRTVGVDALANATIKLKKALSDNHHVTELDCSETMFMSPYHHPVHFQVNASISHRVDPVCHWNFVGTEPCIPTLTCTAINADCGSGEHLYVTDGIYGSARYCHGRLPKNIVASTDLRDLYLKFVTKKRPSMPQAIRLDCTVQCTKRGQSGTHPLPNNLKPKVDPTCHCGQKPNDNRIVNGVEANKNEFPWLVALVEAKTRQPFCGGSILNDRMILTAGHCFKARFLNINNLEIIVNGHVLDATPNLAVMKLKTPAKKYDEATLKKLDKGNGSHRFIPNEVFIHPLYVSETNDFDIAVIHLTRPIDFRALKLARPICLPPLPSSYMRTYGHRIATVAGWGLPAAEAPYTPNRLQKLDVNVFMPSECKELYAHRVNRRMVCAGFKEGGKDSCAGDSGGPLIVEERPKVWTQIGSVSWGDGCAKESNPGVYFRTTESGQWLRWLSYERGSVWCEVPSH